MRMAADLLGVDQAWLAGLDQTATRSPQPDRVLHKTIPLFGQAVAGEDGSFPLNGERLAELPCPPQIENVRDPYAVVISGDSMEPRYRTGTVVYVNPSRVPRRGDDVVIQVKVREELAGYVKEFVQIAQDKITVRQLNPEKKIVFPLSEIQAVHVVQLAER
jgi:phage repressor protein C with HTH and peptisase S24 domain